MGNEFDSLIFFYNTGKKKYIIILESYWLKENQGLEIDFKEYSIFAYDLKNKTNIHIYSGLDGCDEICFMRGIEWKSVFPYKTKKKIINYLKTIEKDGELYSQL